MKRLVLLVAVFGPLYTCAQVYTCAQAAPSSEAARASSHVDDVDDDEVIGSRKDDFVPAKGIVKPRKVVQELVKHIRDGMRRAARSDKNKSSTKIEPLVPQQQTE